MWADLAHSLIPGVDSLGCCAVPAFIRCNMRANVFVGPGRPPQGFKVNTYEERLSKRKTFFLELLVVWPKSILKKHIFAFYSSSSFIVFVSESHFYKSASLSQYSELHGRGQRVPLVQDLNFGGRSGAVQERIQRSQAKNQRTSLWKILFLLRLLIFN